MLVAPLLARLIITPTRSTASAQIPSYKMVSVSPPPRYSAGAYGVDAEKPLGAGSAPARAVNPTQPKTQPPKGATDEKKSTIKVSTSVVAVVARTAHDAA